MPYFGCENDQDTVVTKENGCFSVGGSVCWSTGLSSKDFLALSIK